MDDVTPPIAPTPMQSPPPPPNAPRSPRWPFLALGGLGIIGVVIAFLVGSHFAPQSTAKTSVTPTQATKASTTATTQQGLQLDAQKNYGDKYANGLLPVGDGKYSTAGAKQGYIYACSGYAQNLSSSQAGADSRGPWFTNNNTQYDINKKANVQGAATWTAGFSNTVSGTTRTIATNDLPNHATGIFPIASSDPAYSYDKNPNRISAQSLTYSLPANPSYGSPNCMGGQVGVMLTGVALFNAFDAGGRDAGAWEVQDDCAGHPEKTGEYHYHTLSSCIKDTSVQTVIGFALDGFPITGPKLATGNVLATANLDECHGLTSQINLDSKPVSSYHYVMTEDFPYSASCFRGTASQPPGLPGSSQAQQPKPAAQPAPVKNP